MAALKVQTRFMIPKFLKPSSLFRFPPRNPVNNSKSKPNSGVSCHLEPSTTPTKSENGSEGLYIHEQPFQSFEIQAEKSDISAPIGSLLSDFKGIENKFRSKIEEKGKEVKVDIDDESSSSSSHMRREVKKDINKGKDAKKDDPLVQDEGAIETLRTKELVFSAMGLSFSLFLSLFTFHNPNDMNLGMRIFMHLLPISSVVFLLGIALHKNFPEISDMIKLVGYEFFFLGIYGIMASYLSTHKTFAVPILCAILTTVLLVLVFFKKL